MRDPRSRVGNIPTGSRNAITDVEGVRVGSVTIEDGDVQTGVTVVVPGSGDLFADKPEAACVVANGFGKTTGLVQVDELGQLEAPIGLTNTLAVGTVLQELVSVMCELREDIGRSAGTVNVVVAECNDSYLNDIRSLSVTSEHVREALSKASENVARGAVGAGRGMTCYGMKGGLGTSSRIVELEARRFTVGILVLANFGETSDFLLHGAPVGARLAGKDPAPPGSVIVLVATDAPLDSRQLRRLARRTFVGIARTGSYIQHGSGDIAIAFSTTRRTPMQGPSLRRVEALSDRSLDPIFKAAADATEESVLDALLSAETVRGVDGHVRLSLSEHLASEEDQGLA